MNRKRGALTRRGFIQTGAAMGALSLLDMEAHAMDNPVRVGFVGTGSRGTNLLQTLMTFPNVQVPAVCDLVPDRAARAADIVEKAKQKRPEMYAKDEWDWKNLVERDDLDAVLCATTWEWHAPVSVGAMKAGKFAATEVPAANTVEDCWDLVRTSEATGKPCMMLENVCYFENVLALLRMVREGVFGDLLHAEAGYQHDCRFLLFTEDGQLTWRGEKATKYNGNTYPTHPIGPIAQWFDINRGDRFTHMVHMSTPALGAKQYAAAKFGPDHPLAKRDYMLGDIQTSLLRTEKGRTVTLYFDMNSPRPYDLILRLQGTKGLHMGSSNQIYIEGMSPTPHEYEPFAPYLEKYRHPLWADLGKQAAESGGHGGSDYVTMYEFLKAVRTGVLPQDVYDAATWSVIVPLSEQSAAMGSQPVEFPDFTNGAWKSRPPIGIYGA